MPIKEKKYDNGEGHSNLLFSTMLLTGIVLIAAVITIKLL